MPPGTPNMKINIKSSPMCPIGHRKHPRFESKHLENMIDDKNDSQVDIATLMVKDSRRPVEESMTNDVNMNHNSKTARLEKIPAHQRYKSLRPSSAGLRVRLQLGRSLKIPCSKGPCRRPPSTQYPMGVSSLSGLARAAAQLKDTPGYQHLTRTGRATDSRAGIWPSLRNKKQASREDHLQRSLLPTNLGAQTCAGPSFQPPHQYESLYSTVQYYHYHTVPV
ncbi:hypothetical protein O181_028127 [Austropuccinia psidii MF-1]|uniref:Uncharacterized protein n=1 Tax=Austropuccinia psidii MF-1 TaxID=1389203 RepID=A0A9Q3H2B0_9BASI|nr:hypothetical protein [Austropuccinia psidii MF-1]